MSDLDELLSIDEAADLVGRNPESLRKAAQRGRLASRKIGRTYVTTPRDVARYVAEVEAWRGNGRRRVSL